MKAFVPMPHPFPYQGWLSKPNYPPVVQLTTPTLKTLLHDKLQLIYNYEQKNSDDSAADNTADTDDSAKKSPPSQATDSISHSASL